MKKHHLIIVLVFLILIAVGCDGSSDGNSYNNNGSLSVISNIDKDGNIVSKGIGTIDNAPEIVGVLLKFHKEGLYNRNSSFFKNEYSNGSFKNKNAFYLEYLDHIGKNGDGHEFNYVLYVPDCISEAYTKGHGRNPDSGNPFWWYMATYYGKKVEKIRTNWEGTLEFLLSNRDGLAAPKPEDVGNNWKAEYAKLHPLASAKYKGVEFNKNCLNYYNEGDDVIFVDKIEYYEEGKYSDGRFCQVFIPYDLTNKYFAGSGQMDWSEAVLWYFNKYYGKDRETVISAYEQGKFGQLLEECYAVHDYITPDGKDVDTIIETTEVTGYPYNGESLVGNSGHYYTPGILVLDNGEKVMTENRIFIELVKKHNEDCFNIYAPEAMLEDLKSFNDQKGYHYNLMGGDFVTLVMMYVLDVESHGPEYTPEEINALLEYVYTPSSN